MMRNVSMRPATLLWTVLLACAVLYGCTTSPDDAEWDNPLDPGGPFGGDPFDIQVNFSGGAVFLTWTGIELGGVTGYEILHTLDSDGPFSVIATTDAEMTTYQHAEFVPNQTNYYKVRAIDDDGNASAISHVTAAGITPPTDLSIGETATVVSRQVELTLRSSFGETVEVDSLSDFSSSTSFDLDDDFTITVPWDLGPAAANDEWKHVWVRVHQGESVTDTHHDSVQVSFQPALAFEGNEQTLASRTTPLAIGGSGGVNEMRFAPDRTQLALETPMPGDVSFDGYLLTTAPDSQLVFGEFWCDFGFSLVDSAWAVPDSLSGITIILNGGIETIAEMEIPVASNLRAVSMRFALDPTSLAIAPWTDYATNTTLTHDGCGSEVDKMVYAEFRNDWFHPDAITAEITWLPPEALGAAFAGPDTVTSGAAVTLTGTAVRGTCSDPLDLVELDVGEGWVTATGLADWTLDWTAPVVTAETTTDITIRVTAGAEISPDQTFTVVVTPPDS